MGGIIWMMTLMVLTMAASSSTETYPPFLHHLNRRCPLHHTAALPIEMTDGESLERVLRSTPNHVYTALLFYDSASPFSHTMRSFFDTLSFMFPQLPHIAVERSVTMPSLFSRYGIHSLPALFIVNKAADVRYYGSKDIHSLTAFYKRLTGIEPVDRVQYVSSDTTERKASQIYLEPWYRSSWREIVVKEPYLVFAILFLLLRGFIYICPDMWFCVAALWMLCKRHFNAGMLGESNQLLGHVAHLMDVRRIWSKLKLWSTGNFRKGAMSARVWASSLASVSLGDSSGRQSSLAEG